MYRNGEYEIATIKARPLFLKLSDADCDRILQLTAGYGLTVSELLENFVTDLVGGTCTNGSDERSLAQDWFSRCCFQRRENSSLLRHLLEEGEDIAHFVNLYDENEEYKSHPEEFEKSREDYGLAPDEPFDFEYELARLLDDWKADRSAVDMAAELETVCAYLQEREDLMKGYDLSQCAIHDEYS